MALTNSQYDTVMREFEARRMGHERAFRKKLALAYGKFPRIREIENEIARLSVQKARIALGGNDTTDFNLTSKIQALSEEKKTLLKMAGFENGIAAAECDCGICKDTGVVDGRTCSCFKLAGIKLVYSQSGLMEILEEENFGTFDLSLYPDTGTNADSGRTPRQMAKYAYDFSWAFVKGFGGKKGENICFIGKPGVGKTFLSHCIAKALMDRGVGVVYLTASDLFGAFEENAFRPSEKARENSRLIFECDLLIIDDLGANLANSFTTSQLFNCLNSRILDKKSTVISTNLSLSEMRQVYSERVTSRLTYSYQRIYLYGDDIRVKKKAMAVQSRLDGQRGFKENREHKPTIRL